MDTHPRAETIARSVADRDLEKIGAELTDDVRLRAILPVGMVEVHGREEVLANFDAWFRDYATVELVDTAGDSVGDRLLVHYKLHFTHPVDPPTVLSQTWVGSVGADGRLFRIDVLCSGFRKR